MRDILAITEMVIIGHLTSGEECRIAPKAITTTVLHIVMRSLHQRIVTRLVLLITTTGVPSTAVDRFTRIGSMADGKEKRGGMTYIDLGTGEVTKLSWEEWAEHAKDIWKRHFEEESKRQSP